MLIDIIVLLSIVFGFLLVVFPWIAFFIIAVCTRGGERILRRLRIRNRRWFILLWLGVSSILMVGSLSLVMHMLEWQYGLAGYPDSSDDDIRYFEHEIQMAIERLTEGKIVFNPPPEMKVGVKERIVARIAREITEESMEELTVGLGEHEMATISVGPFMAVRLTGGNFDIKKLSHGAQLVPGAGFTQWDWDVTPLESGTHYLEIRVSVRIKIPEYGEEIKDYPVFRREIEVKVNPVYSIKKLAKNHWTWIITTIITVGTTSGVFAWVKRRARSRRKSDVVY